MQRLISKMLDNFFSAAILALVLAYPILSYFGIRNLTAAQFAWAIMAAFIVRFAIIKEARQARQWPILVGVIIFCAFVIANNSEQLLRFYPVLMNTGFGLLFLNSLRGQQSLIEQFMRAGGKIPPTHALGYLRSLSAAWGILLLVNAFVSGYTACCSTPYVWALYNGALSYVVIAIFVAVELIYRQYYRRRQGITSD